MKNKYVISCISENRNKKIRYNLKVAVKMRDRERLPPAMEDFKNAKLPDDDKDYEKGERLLKEWQARDGKNLLCYINLRISAECIC